MGTRRIGAEDSKSRSSLLDAAQELMIEEGYAAVSSRRVAAKAGLKPQLVHYYFRTMDDLFLALLRRGAEQNLVRQERALSSSRPLRALWSFSTEPAGTSLMMEFIALANHRKAIRNEIATYAEQFRRLQVDAFRKIREKYELDAAEFPPEFLAMLMTSLSRVLVLEGALGVTTGHPETEEAVERFLASREPLDAST